MYKLFIERAVIKQLRKVPKKDYKKIMGAISALAENQRPAGYKKLKAGRGTGFVKEITGSFTKLMITAHCYRD